MTRAEHLAWCKKRALEYINQGDIVQGITSMISDLRKHPETNDDILISMTAQLLMGGHLNTVSQARHHIEGFN